MVLKVLREDFAVAAEKRLYTMRLFIAKSVTTEPFSISYAPFVGDCTTSLCCLETQELFFVFVLHSSCCSHVLLLYSTCCSVRSVP